jgi:cytochrome P450
MTGYADSLRLLRSRGTEPIGLHKSWHRLREKYGYDFPAATDLVDWAPFNFSGSHHAVLRRAFAQVMARYAGSDHIFARRFKRLLEPVRRAGGFDLAGQFANRILFDVLCDLAGIAESDRSELVALSRLSWAIETTISMSRRALLESELQRAHRLLLAELDHQLNRSADTLLTEVRRQVAPYAVDANGATATVFSVMLVMGNDALGGSLASGVRQLLSQSGAFAIDQADWSRHSDEVLRYAASVDFLSRVLTHPFEADGLVLNAGERVMVSPLAANHDIEEFGPNADNIGATDKGVGLTFGAGVHICVGMQIARRLMRLALGALADLPPLRMLGTAEPVGKVIRSFDRMPVQLG